MMCYRSIFCACEFYNLGVLDGPDGHDGLDGFSGFVYVQTLASLFDCLACYLQRTCANEVAHVVL